MRTKPAWLVALQIVRDGVNSKQSRQELLSRLNTEAPAELGRWDTRRLSDVIRRLRRGIYGLDPLPAILPAEQEARDVLAAIEERHAAGHSWAEIANHLNTAGYRPQRGQQFTRALVYSLYLRASQRRS
jgi:hypothetical protein